MTETELYTMAEAARRLAVTRQTLYRLHKRGLLEFVKIGAAIRISAAELARFIEASTLGRQQTEAKEG